MRVALRALGERPICGGKGGAPRGAQGVEHVLPPCSTGPRRQHLLPLPEQLRKDAIAAHQAVGGPQTSSNAPLALAIHQHLCESGPDGTAHHRHLVRQLAVLEDAEHYYLVTELMDRGELFELAEAPGAPEATVRGYLWQAVQALKGLHARGYCHRDVSLENFLMSSEPAPAALGAINTLKLCDFGSCAALPRGGGGELMAPVQRLGACRAEREMHQQHYIPAPLLQSARFISWRQRCIGARPTTAAQPTPGAWASWAQPSSSRRSPTRRPTPRVAREWESADAAMLSHTHPPIIGPFCQVLQRDCRWAPCAHGTELGAG